MMIDGVSVVCADSLERRGGGLYKGIHSLERVVLVRFRTTKFT